MAQGMVNMKTGQMIMMMKQFYAKGKELYGNEAAEEDMPMLAEQP